MNDEIVGKEIQYYSYSKTKSKSTETYYHYYYGWGESVRGGSIHGEIILRCFVDVDVDFVCFAVAVVSLATILLIVNNGTW